MDILIKVAFEGYPDGTIKSRTFYAVGDTPSVPEDFANMVIKKGLAVALPERGKAAPVGTDTANKESSK
jgi:hypothetical protein